MSLREMTTRDPFAPTYTVDPARYPAPRHQAAPAPNDTAWVAATMALWSVGLVAAVIAIWVFGPVFNLVWVFAGVLIVAGAVTFLIAWDRADARRRRR